jgi:hypothetical protein
VTDSERRCSQLNLSVGKVGLCSMQQRCCGAAMGTTGKPRSHHRPWAAQETSFLHETRSERAKTVMHRSTVPMTARMAFAAHSCALGGASTQRSWPGVSFSRPEAIVYLFLGAVVHVCHTKIMLSHNAVH